MDGQLIQRWMKSCRLCLLDDGVKLPIFGEEGIVREVAHKIQSCFPIVLYNADPLSKIICQRCLFMLDTVYSFRQKCVETNDVFTSHLMGLKSNSSSVKQYLLALEKSKAPPAASSPTITQISPAQRREDRRPPPPVNRPASCRVETDPLANTGNESHVSPTLVRIKQEPGTKPAKTVPMIVSVVGSYSDGVPGPSTAPPTPFAMPRAIKIKQEYGGLRGKAKRNFKLLTPWHCKFCKKYYKNKNTLYKHRKYFCPFKTFNCGKCNQVFLSDSERLQHWATHMRVHVSLKDKDLHTCPICQRRFAYKPDLKNHLKVHEGDDDQYMLNGAQTDDSQSSDSLSNQSAPVPRQISHRRFRGSGERFTCEVCFRSYSRKTKMNYHFKQFHRAEWLAKNQKPVVSETAVEETEPQVEAPSTNLLNPSAPRYRPAPLSKQKFKKDSQGLLRQLLSKPKCEICHKVFNNRSGLSNHMRTHTPKNPHRCVVCGRLFGSKKGLLYHEKARHGVAAPRDAYRCKACDRSFKTRSEWLLHTLTHDKTKKEMRGTDDSSLASTKLLLCSYCNQVFSESAAYKEHMQTHKVTNTSLVNVSASAPDMRSTMWSCDLCSKVFAVKRNLVRHQAVHSARTHSSHPCNVCDKLFLSRASLLRHMPTHSNPTLSKTFHCSLCNKIFFKIEALHNHTCTPGGQTGTAGDPEGEQLEHPFQDKLAEGERYIELSYEGKPYTERIVETGDVASGLPFHKPPQNCNFCGYARLNGHKCLYRKDNGASLNHTAKKTASKTYGRFSSYKCRICSATFASSYSHNSHMKVHKRGKFYRPILKVPTMADRQAVAGDDVMFLAGESEGGGLSPNLAAPLDLRFTAPTDTSYADEPEPTALDNISTGPFITVSDLFAAADRGTSATVGAASVSLDEGSGSGLVDEVGSGSDKGVGVDLVEGGGSTLVEEGSSGLVAECTSSVVEGDNSVLTEAAYSPEPVVQDPVINDIFFDENEFYQCAQCTKTFHSELGLASHVKTDHETVTTEIQLQCPFCVESYPDTQSVDQHILLNHPESSGVNC